MNDRKRRLLSMIVAAAGIGLMLTAATHASTSFSARAVLEKVDAEVPLLDPCRKKPQWKQVWDENRNRTVWKEDWVEDCKSAN